MEPISTLGSLMGLAFISGIRLYSTILVVGLGIRFGVIHLPQSLVHLQSLASTPILLIAGFLYSIEFVADKIPWVDSFWDAIHTFVRPLGAAILGAVAIGTVDPTIKLGAFLLCGAVGLASHSAKSGTRLVANHSPEPISNIGLSFAEDGLVAGGSWLIFAYPIIALVLVVCLIVIIVWTIPKLFRLYKRNLPKLKSFLGQ